MRRPHRFVAAAFVLAGVAAGAGPVAGEDPIRVLYLEGEPRFEYKFIRRAAGGADDLLFGSIVYTAENDPGPPAVPGADLSRQSLAGLDVLVLGSLHRAAFTETQLEDVVRWVEAGGRLLLLGGRDALANGDWADSPLDPLLPIEPTSKLDVHLRVRDDRQRINAEIEELKREQERLRREMEGLQGAQAQGPVPATAGDLSNRRPRLRVSGSRHLRVEPEPSELDHPFFDFEEGADVFFETLPELFAQQVEALPRAEATVLLRDRDDPTFTVLAYTERGDGLCAVLTVTNTWQWRMHAELPVDDRRHDRFWQRLLRWLGEATP